MGEEFQCPFPQDQRYQREQESLTNSTKTDSITLKAIREEYHNPDPIV